MSYFQAEPRCSAHHFWAKFLHIWINYSNATVGLWRTPRNNNDVANCRQNKPHREIFLNMVWGTRGRIISLPLYPMANISEDSPLLFCERPDWADVTPLEQYENLTPIAPILYSEECKQRSLFFFHSCNAESFIIIIIRQRRHQLLSRNR